MSFETLTLEAGERGEVVLYPEGDVRDPRVVVEGSDYFVVEEVLAGNVQAPRVDVRVTRRGEWSAVVRDVSCGPETPLKVVVRNTCGGRISLRATVTSEEDRN